MNEFANRLLTSTMMPLLVGLGAVGVTVTQAPRAPLAACKPANPCAGKKNPRAAARPCSPCAGRNPRAAKHASNPCSPCNPCAAGAHGACNPCSPCNPCAATAAGSSGCVVPSLTAAATKNPRAAKKACAPCNPCAAGACAPCNPCAARNPCAAGACGPCSPCAPHGAGQPVEVSAEEAEAAYDCIREELAKGYSGSGRATAAAYGDWTRYNSAPYQSGTHGSRYVNNYANGKAADYGKFEDAGILPVGSIVAKDSFVVTSSGKVAPGPLFTMEKMKSGFRADSGDWKYALIMPNGTVMGETNGKGAQMVEFCIGCHAAAGEDQDQLFFLPKEYRTARK